MLFSSRNSLLAIFLFLFLISLSGRNAFLWGGGEEEANDDAEEEEAHGEEDQDHDQDQEDLDDLDDAVNGTDSDSDDLDVDEPYEDSDLPFKSRAEELAHLKSIEREQGARLGSDHHEDDEEDHNEEFDHQSFVGSREEDAEYHNLPPEEAKKRLKGLITKIDEGGDGYISHDELQKWIMKSFVTLNQEESVSRFHEHDQDEDGKLGWEEYLKSVYGYVPTVAELAADDNEDAKHFVRVYREDERKFVASDVDGDGLVTEDEFAAFYHPEDYPHMHEIELKRIVEETDKDGDGAINLPEFLGDVAGDDPEEWTAVESDRFKRALDLDGNGKLEGEELKAWAIPSNEEIAKDEATHLIGVADKDRDALLSVQEILDESDLFVGSAATDYGKHLDDEL